jgi:thymidylate synthase (FAD)
MKVELIDRMGSDLSVVNSARVSMNKASDWDQMKDTDGTVHRVLSTKDAKLLRYLAEHNHHTPFCHATVTFRIECSIAVCRQLAKSQVGATINETSRRYVDATPTLDMPTQWRKRAPNVKQGSSDELVTIDPSMQIQIDKWQEMTTLLYEDLLLLGVCPEQARFVLPLCMNTEFYWTGSLLFFARVCRLRLDPHAQRETREVAERISSLMSELFPESWNVLMA